MPSKWEEIQTSNLVLSMCTVTSNLKGLGDCLSRHLQVGGIMCQPHYRPTACLLFQLHIICYPALRLQGCYLKKTD